MKRSAYWDVKAYDISAAQRLAEALQVSPAITGILMHRGLTDETSMKEFLFGKAEPYYDPFLLKDMERAARRIQKAREAGEKITVFGDYDVDGITASSLLYLYLAENGADVQTYIPRRQGEGYGLNNEALETLYQDGVTLVITVDCGISGVQEVAAAPAGLDIIITDHHRPPETLPAAYAIVNPRQPHCEYPFKGLSGVGVAFKLCQALHKLSHPEEPLWENYTELAALGTVADIVPLQDENRVLVKRGLKAMGQTSLVGLRKLLEVCHCDRVPMNSEKIGFVLAPRLNAAGRLEHAQLAVELLTTEKAEAALEMARQLNEENALRQEISHQIFIEAEQMLQGQEKLPAAIVLAKEGWHPGVIGIVASRLVDKYYRPVILLSVNGEQTKGSCRSIPPLDMYDALQACEANLIQFGGHSQAAGLTLETDKLENLCRDFIQVTEQRLSPEDFRPHIAIDMVVQEPGMLTLDFLHEVELLEPFGCENPAPLFMLKDAVLHNPRPVGREQNHLRFFVDVGKTSCHCIMWQGAVYADRLYNNVEADIVFKPEINVYNGMESINLEILAFRMEMELYDYRKGTEDKSEVLRRLLRQNKKFTVFVNEKNEETLWLQKFSQVTLRQYGSLCEAGERRVIFYDLPRTDIFRRGVFPVAAGPGKSLYILYNMLDWQREKQNTLSCYPNRNHLIDAYRFVTKVLRSQAVAKVEQLKAQSAAQQLTLTENDLRIFAELEFFRIQGDVVLPGSTRHRQLEDSPTYVALRKECDALAEIYYSSLRLARARIQSLRFK